MIRGLEVSPSEYSEFAQSQFSGDLCARWWARCQFRWVNGCRQLSHPAGFPVWRQFLPAAVIMSARFVFRQGFYHRVLDKVVERVPEVFEQKPGEVPAEAMANQDALHR